MGTGDADSECRLYRSDDLGEHWEIKGGGSQLWRAVGVAFAKDAVYWGTDAGSDAGVSPNHIVRFDRSSEQLRKIQKIQGPCHGVGILANGTIVISTGVEGGQNETDDRAHLWICGEDDSCSEVVSFRKKRWPHVVQYGVLRIPPGTENCDHIDFSGLALRGAGEAWFRGKIVR
jgi:hypothetical protein